MDTSSDLAWCYQILELPTDSTEQEIKLAYRKLARRYHPDLNPGNRNAEARFKQIALAYQTLLTAARQIPHTAQTKSTAHTKSYSASTQPTTSAATSTSGRVRFYVKHQEQSKTRPSVLSPHERWLKTSTLNQIHSLLKREKWQQAVDVAEKLTTRFPDEPDVYQWLALTYHRWAKKLIERRQYERARIYLKKALQTDPHNKKLWLEIDRDYKSMERQLHL
jgi:tetratricopeptide (TPR) repeat protein